MKTKLVVLMGASLALVDIASGQPVIQNDVSGNECWNAGQGPGGVTTGFLCLPLVRNGADIRLFSGTTATLATTSTVNDGTMFWTGAAPTSWNITLIAPPFDGQIVSILTDTTITTAVSIVAGTGTTMNVAVTTATITPTTGIVLQYDRGTTKWYRIR